MEVTTLQPSGPARLYAVLAISVVLLVPLAILSNITHSLTLALEAYHMLYNVMTLAGCLVATRLADAGGSVKNTYGWARMEVLATVTTLLFLAALCFSVAVEAVQTMVHADHLDAMHHPLYIMCSAAAILLANLVCYVLIGGYTNLQGTLLAPGPSRRFSVASTVQSKSASAAQRRLDSYSMTTRLIHHFLRDIGGTLLLVAAAATTYVTQAMFVRYLDPVLAMVGIVVLMATSRPFFSECCMILLETMPHSFDVDEFRAKLLARFPAVQDVHELHVWRLTPGCVVATAHVVLDGPRQFNEVARGVAAFFAESDVTQVTLQPEFSAARRRTARSDSRCLLPCKDSCMDRWCCDEARPRARLPTITVTAPSQPSLASMASFCRERAEAAPQPPEKADAQPEGSPEQKREPAPELTQGQTRGPEPEPESGPGQERNSEGKYEQKCERIAEQETESRPNGESGYATEQATASECECAPNDGDVSEVDKEDKL